MFEMSEQGYAGHESANEGDRSARGNVGYSPYVNEKPSVHENHTAKIEPSVILESSAVGLLPDHLKNTTNTLHQGYQGGRRVAATKTLPSFQEFPTTLQHTSNSMPVLIGIPTDRQQKVDKSGKKEKSEKGEKRERSKNGQAKKPFKAKWYSADRVYSDLTYYHKITIPGLVAFLEGEGIDVNFQFPAKARYYLIKKDGSLKELNRGWAIVQKTKMVHQRVINSQKSGPNTGPDCSDRENNDSLLIDTGSTGYVSTAFGKNDPDDKPAEEAFEGDSVDGDFEWDDEPINPNPVISFRNSMNFPELGNAYSCGGDQSLYIDNTGMDAGALLNQHTSDYSAGMNAGCLRGQGTDASCANKSVALSNGSGRITGVSKSQTFGRKTKRPLQSDSDSDGEDATHVQSNHQQAARPAKIQKTGLITNGHATQSANPDFAPCKDTRATLPLPQPDQQTYGEVGAVRNQIPGEAQAFLSGMDIIVVLNMFNGLKKLQEKCMAEISHMILQSVQNGNRAFAAESATTPTDQQPAALEYTVNSEGTLVGSAGEIIISIEVQKLVQMIVSAEALYIYNEVFRPREGDVHFFREEQSRINYKDYHLARSILIRRLETDVDWTINYTFRRLEIIEVVEKIWPRLRFNYG